MPVRACTCADWTLTFRNVDTKFQLFYSCFFMLHSFYRVPVQITVDDSSIRHTPHLQSSAVPCACNRQQRCIRWRGTAVLCAKNRADASRRVGVASCCLLAYSRPVRGMSSAAPTLYRDLHKKFIHNLDRAKDSYEFAVTDQLRMSGKFLRYSLSFCSSTTDVFFRWLLGSVSDGSHG
jgi:hypothetical protein